MDAVIAARSAGVNPPPDPLEILFDLLIEESGSISTIYAHHTEEDMNLALVQPWCSIGSDGLALATAGPCAPAILILGASEPFRAFWACTFGIEGCCGWRTQCGR